MRCCYTYNVLLKIRGIKLYIAVVKVYVVLKIKILKTNSLGLKGTSSKGVYSGQ